MKRKFLIAVSVLFLLALTQHFALAQKSTAATRVKFARDATTATVTGRFRGFKDRTAFVIRVKKGQTLEVNQLDSGSDGSVYLGILSPSGEDESDGEANCNNHKRVENTTAGDYRIDVTECMKADAWRGTFRLKFTVK